MTVRAYIFSLTLLSILISGFNRGYAQEEENSWSGNAFTSGLFLPSGKYEVKLFNAIYTERYGSGLSRRSTYMSSFLLANFGTAGKLNWGMDAIYRSSVTQDFSMHSPLRALRFERMTELQIREGDSLTTSSDHGLSHAGGHIRIKPLRNKRFTFQQVAYAPLSSSESWVINTDFFYEKVIRERFMLFADLGVWLPVGHQPFFYGKLFAGTIVMKRLGPYIMLNLPYEAGAGLKAFLSPCFEMEVLFSKWLPIERIVMEKRPVTLNFGFRYSNLAALLK